MAAHSLVDSGAAAENGASPALPASPESAPAALPSSSEDYKDHPNVAKDHAQEHHAEKLRTSYFAAPSIHSLGGSTAAVGNSCVEIPVDSDPRRIRMFKFTLYETASRFFLIGADILDQRFRVLKIDRTGGAGTAGGSNVMTSSASFGVGMGGGPVGNGLGGMSGMPGGISPLGTEGSGGRSKEEDTLAGGDGGDVFGTGSQSNVGGTAAIGGASDQAGPGISEDSTVYSKAELNELISTLDEGNKSSGGLRLRCTCWGLLGFIRFTGGYYMLVVTKRSQVALVGGHYVYKVDGTELISLSKHGARYGRGDAHPEEGRYLNIFNLLDLNNSFYFSYSYDITNTLQHNLAGERRALAQGKLVDRERRYNDMFVWNHHLLEPAAKVLTRVYEWCIALVHGYVDQAKLSVLGRPIYLTLIARRSRYFAGARFLKRGANDLGYVANDVETEQIVAEMQTTPFHAPGPKPFANPNYTSYVQYRGSIPLHWTQDNSGVSPKPDINLNLIDPFYTAASLHFNNLFDRYGAPVFVLNLVKSKERTPRESKLLKEYAASLHYLNRSLPTDKQILYRAWDMSRASKNDQNVIETLEAIAEDIIAATGFFKNGNVPGVDMKVQNGVSRTNCIDCLDRTNAAQSVIGKVALGHQLHALGILASPHLEYDTDVINLFTHMYHNHGDNIAIQYGGSHLVNTMETYRKTNQWSSQSRDMVESLKRYVNNSFLDAQRQEAYNLFLGNYIFAQGQPMLWELPSDYYLHHADPRRWVQNKGRNYAHWFNPRLLEDRGKSMVPLPRIQREGQEEASDDHGSYWPEYYRPLALTSFGKVFASKLPSTLEYIPYKSSNDSAYDPSPFRVRLSHEQQQEADGKSGQKKGIKIIEPSDRPNQTPKPSFVLQKEVRYSDWRKSSVASTKSVDDEGPDSRAGVTQYALNQLVKTSLHPSMKTSDLEEYSQYLTHSENIELLQHGDEVFSPLAFEYANYVQAPISFDNTHVTHLLEEDLSAYTEYLQLDDEPLTVHEDDFPKKRYTAYKKWLRGKSLFKQSRIDPDAIPRVS